MKQKIQLLDQYGNPVQRQVLTEEVSAPSLRSVRQINSGHPATGLTPGRLGALLRQAEEGDPTAQCWLAEEMEEKDQHYASVLSTRKRAVSQLEITVDPASDSAEDEAAAQLIRDVITDRDELEEELVDILDAIGKGYSFTEIIWDTSESQWSPLRLEYRLPGWFEFDRGDGATPLLKTERGPEPLAPYKFIHHVAKAKSGLKVRGGLARLCAWGFLFKNFAIKDWASFMESFGQPLRIGRFHAGATEEEKAQLLRAVVGIGAEFGAIIPEQMALEFIESGSKTASADLYEKFARYFDGLCSKAVLGQTMTTDDGSSWAQAEVHNEVREDIERSDAKQLATTLNRDLVRPTVDLNLGPRRRYPKLKIGRPESEDLDALVDRVVKVVPLGVKVGKRQLANKLGLEEPEADDELLGVAAPPTEPPEEPATEAPEPTEEPGADPDEAKDPQGQALARVQPPIPQDAIDGLVADALAEEGWQEGMKPLVRPIAGALEAADDPETFKAQLAGLLAELDASDLTDLLARAGFTARLAGEVGAPLSPEDEL